MVRRELGEHSTDISFAKSETTQGSEGLDLCLRQLRLGQLTVCAAVSVLEADSGGDAAGDDELPAVRCSVMHAAERDEVVGLIPAAFGAELEVMKVQK